MSRLRGIATLQTVLEELGLEWDGRGCLAFGGSSLLGMACLKRNELSWSTVVWGIWYIWLYTLELLFCMSCFLSMILLSSNCCSVTNLPVLRGPC